MTSEIMNATTFGSPLIQPRATVYLAAGVVMITRAGFVFPIVSCKIFLLLGLR
jgi:hypothetical protein